MASTERQVGESPAKRMRQRFAAGDFKGARSDAWAVLHDERASEQDRAEAERLRSHTEVDKRAWGIAAFALAIAATVLIFFIL